VRGREKISLCGCHSGLDSIHKPNLKSKIRLLTGLIALAGLRRQHVRRLRTGGQAVHYPNRPKLAACVSPVHFTPHEPRVRSVNEKALALPGSLSTPIVPCCASTASLQKASPMPVECRASP